MTVPGDYTPRPRRLAMKIHSAPGDGQCLTRRQGGGTLNTPRQGPGKCRFQRGCCKQQTSPCKYRESLVAGSFRKDFRRFFVRGLAAVLPAILTVAILVWLFTLIQKYIGKHINKAVQWVVVQFYCLLEHTPLTWKGPDNEWNLFKAVWNEYHLGWIGFLLAFVAIYVFGRFVASFIGRGVWATIEHALTRTPVIKQIYPNAKQVTDFLLSEQRMEFSHVVAVEYPRKGIWSIGLMTGTGMRTLNKKIASDLLTVFIPSSPTPFTGYTITVRREDVIDLPLSIDEALRFTVSGGVLVPPKERLPGSFERLIAQKASSQSESSAPAHNGEASEQQSQQQVPRTPERERPS